MVFISHLVLCLVFMHSFVIQHVNGKPENDGQSVKEKRSLCTLCDVKSLLHRIELILNPTRFIVKDCADLYEKGFTSDGVYQINPDGHGSFPVRCDMTTDGGGWTIFQRRIDGSEDFYRGWEDYKRGFGDMKKEFWLGLDKIHQLTPTPRVLRVDMEDTSGNKAHAVYKTFSVSDVSSKYQLSVGGYQTSPSGSAGDSLSAHNGAKFSTKDSDNDVYSGSCAVQFKGAWWYTACHGSNLNGHYYHGAHTSYADGVNWSAWKGAYYSLKKTEMKIRPFRS